MTVKTTQKKYIKNIMDTIILFTEDIFFNLLKSFIL